MLALLGFDASSPALVEELLEAGRLPVLAELRGRGRRLELATPATALVASTYHTLWSGLEAGEHGLYYPFQWSAAEQRVRPFPAFPAPEPFWERLAANGVRALVVDPYEARRARRVEGVVVSGWQFKNRVALRRYAVPARAGRQAARRHGRGPAAEEVFGRPSPAGLLRLARVLGAAPGRVADLAGDVLARERFDLLVASFPAVHLAGHQLWDLSQLAGHDLDPATRAELSGALAEICAATDAAVGRIVAALPSGADVVVFSPLGMGVNTSRADLLPGMLEAVLTGRPARPDAGGSSLWRLRAAIPTGWRSAIAGALPDRLVLELAARLDLRGVDWRRTRAFALPSDHHGYVRLNLRGRERDGVLAAGDVDALLEEIRTGLATFCDPDGAPAVAAVERTSDLIAPGARSDLLPDLVVRWSDRPATRLDRVRSPVHGEVARAGAGSGRSGNHTDEAWALVVPGASRHRTLARPPRLVDLAATAAALLGGDTAGLAGEPLLEADG